MSFPSARRVSTVLAALALALFSGCQEAFPVVLRGVVRNAKDGSPVAGVKVTLSPEHGWKPVSENAFPVVSGEDGTFRVVFEMMDAEFNEFGDKSWSVSLSKEGYHDETLDIGAF